MTAPAERPAERGSPFRRRTLGIIFGVGLSSLVITLLIMAFGDQLAPPRHADANAYSRSAIGHRGVVEMLRALDVPVVVSQYRSGAKLGGEGLLVIAEPHMSESTRASLAGYLENASSEVLLVLPKWDGDEDPKKPGWLGQVRYVSTAEAREVLAELVGEGALDIVRLARGQQPSFHVEDGDDLVIDGPQLMVGAELDPIIETEQGILLGTVWAAEREVLVLSDPDLLNNHGLARGDNAEITAALIDAFRDGGAVVFDETLHGFVSEPSIWREIFQFPLALATTSALLAVLLLVWTAIRRFGPPRPAPRAVEPGKAFLIHNTALLLHHGGHGRHMLERYVQATIRDVASRLHAPAEASEAQVRTWLDRLATSRKVSVSLADLEREAAEVSDKRGQHRQILLIANRMYRWKQEMLHGPRNHPRRQ